MSAPKIPHHDFSLLLICSCCFSVVFKHSRSRVSTLHPWKPESGSLQNSCCALLTTPKTACVFVKTVFSAFERFDSAPVERMRGLCHLFVKRCWYVYSNVMWVRALFPAGQIAPHFRVARDPCLMRQESLGPFGSAPDRLALGDWSEARRPQILLAY